MSTYKNHPRTTWLVFGITVIAALAIGFSVARLDAQRRAGPGLRARNQTVEYLLIPSSDVGLTMDLVPVINHEETTRLLNRYAAQGWRVHQAAPFDLPAILLERDIGAE